MSEQKFLTKQDIIQVEDLDHADVEVPEWGGTVRVRSLNTRERGMYLKKTTKTTSQGVTTFDPTNSHLLVAMTCIDPETGKRLFTDDEASIIGRKHPKAVDRLLTVASELSGLGKEELEQAKKDS